jgi:hypothetical protein
LRIEAVSDAVAAAIRHLDVPQVRLHDARHT